MSEGLVGGEGFAIDASVIKADANRARGVPGSESAQWRKDASASRAVREYLDALDETTLPATTKVNLRSRRQPARTSL
jgi:hypothetical protein